MKKNDLIKLLQEIEGNPDVVVWNGFVGDYQHIDTDLVQCELVKETVEFQEKNLLQEWCLDNETLSIPLNVRNKLSDLAKKLYKKNDWDLPNSCVKDEDFKKWYGDKRKSIIILNTKGRNKNYFDRVGKLSY